MRILVVDDNDMLAEALIFGLTDRGHQVSRARNGREALEESLAAEPQVVIIDWQMPGMRGDQVAREVRARAPQVAIILMSGDSVGTDIRNVCGAGGVADNFIEKPFTPNQLLNIIQQALDHRLPAAGTRVE